MYFDPFNIIALFNCPILIYFGKSIFETKPRDVIKVIYDNGFIVIRLKISKLLYARISFRKNANDCKTVLIILMNNLRRKDKGNQWYDGGCISDTKFC